MIPPTFKCQYCGGDTLVEPPDRLAICPVCCMRRSEHEFEYSREDRQWRCVHCDDFPHLDFYDDPD